MKDFPENEEFPLAPVITALVGDWEGEEKFAAISYLHSVTKPNVAESGCGPSGPTDVKKSTHLTRVCLPALVVFTTVFGLLASWDDLQLCTLLYGWQRLDADQLDAKKSAAIARLAQRLPPATRARFFDGLALPDAAYREKLWRQDPGNARLFMLYAEELAQMKKLPDDFLATAAEIDPGNAWYFYRWVSIQHADVVKSETLEKSGKTTAFGFAVADPEIAETLVAELIETTKLPRFEDYFEEEKIALYRAAAVNSVDGEFEASCGLPWRDPGLFLFATERLFEWAIWQAGEQGNAPRYDELRDAALRWITQQTSRPKGLVGSIVAQRSLKLIAKRCGEAAQKLGRDNEKKYWDAILIQFSPQLGTPSGKPIWVDGMPQDSARVADHWQQSEISSLISRTEKPIHVTDAVLHPRRMIDHEWWSMLSAWLAWMGFAGVGLGLLACRRCFRKLNRNLATRLEGELTVVDWCWIFASGLLALFYVAIINRLTPLEGIDLAFRERIFCCLYGTSSRWWFCGF